MYGRRRRYGRGGMFGVPRRKCRRICCMLLIFIVVFTFVFFWILGIIMNPPRPRRHRFVEEDPVHMDTNGVQVVVGHYMGNEVNKIPNASLELINTNNFNPEPDAGKNGHPVVTQPKDLLLMQQLFQINRFNLLASDRIPLNRSLPDYRRKRCDALYKDYLDYPKTSVIIVFHNEAWSTLLRTVWSVINRSPPELLEEIILVDDASERAFLRRPLEDYVDSLPVRTRILRSSQRIGLIKARLRGARAARGQVLTFLDAHCECTKGWLEPLLAVIKGNRKVAVCPIIDIISDDTFAYVKSYELHWGAFNWNLQFRWFTLPADQLKKRGVDPTGPFFTPTMAGGLFAIERRYFFEMGAYDDGMDIWGGENLEMSFRLWQCGGEVQIAPCSRVGHLFRKSSPYSFPGGIGQTLFGNLARVAMTWMDEWAGFYFRFNSEADWIKRREDVSLRLGLRGRLKCRDFRWYLENVWPQHFFPADDRFFGRIKNVQESKCLMKPGRKSLSNQPVGLASLDRCQGNNVTLEKFVISPEGLVMTDDSICLDAPEKTTIGPPKVRIMACTGLSRQKWEYDSVKSEFRHVSSQKCLDLQDSTYLEGVTLTNCDGRPSQKWVLESVPWK